MEVLNKPGHFINTLRRFPQDEWNEGRGGGGGMLDVLDRVDVSKSINGDREDQWVIHPLKLTWNLKIPPWKGRNIYKPLFFGFYVKFRGCNPLILING